MHPLASWRGPAIRAMAAAAFGLAGLAGCTMVGESLNGVSLSKEHVQNCISQCNQASQVQMQEEQKLHHQNVDECLQLSDSDKSDCLNAEGARHSSAVQSIVEGKKDCNNNCHSQGRGSVG